VASARQAALHGEHRLESAEQRDADERDHFRFVAANLALENLPSFHVLDGREIVDAGTRTRDQVRDPESEFRQPHIVAIGNRLRNQPRLREQLPEAVREAGEMMARLRRSHARVDPDKEHAHTGPDAIPQSKVGPIHGCRVTC
jgi:hypothetical protein